MCRLFNGVKRISYLLQCHSDIFLDKKKSLEFMVSLAPTLFKFAKLLFEK